MTGGLGEGAVLSAETKALSAEANITSVTNETRGVTATESVATTIKNEAGASSSQVNFIVDVKGQAFPVPKGAVGPTPTPSGKGIQFSGGNGGMNGQVSTMRIMDPMPAKGDIPAYPGGYIKYENASGQGVNPYTGQTGSNAQVHYPIYSYEFKIVQP